MYCSSSPAARRFFTLFYQWSALRNHTQSARCPHIAPASFTSRCSSRQHESTSCASQQSREQHETEILQQREYLVEDQRPSPPSVTPVPQGVATSYIAFRIPAAIWARTVDGAVTVGRYMAHLKDTLGLHTYKINKVNPKEADKHKQGLHVELFGNSHDLERVRLCINEDLQKLEGGSLVHVMSVDDEWRYKDSTGKAVDWLEAFPEEAMATSLIPGHEAVAAWRIPSKLWGKLSEGEKPLGLRLYRALGVYNSAALEARPHPTSTPFARAEHRVSLAGTIRSVGLSTRWLQEQIDLVRAKQEQRKFVVSLRKSTLAVRGPSQYTEQRFRAVCEYAAKPAWKVFPSLRSPQEVLEPRVKTVFRALTHPVVVITCRNVGGNSNGGTAPNSTIKTKNLTNCRGVTVSSFNTVTLTPEPIVSFNLRSDSRTLEALRASGSFIAHILSATPQGAALADVFAKPRNDPAEVFLEDSVGRAVDISPEPSRAPGLRGMEGAVLARIECFLTSGSPIQVGDHSLILAEVWDVEILQENPDSMVQPGLSYSARSYRKLGDEIDVPEEQDARVASSQIRRVIPAPVSLKIDGPVTQTIRSYSTTAIRHQQTREPRQRDDILPVADRRILSQTVGDFLSHPENPTHGTYRMKGLHLAQKEIHIATYHLRRGQKRGTLDPQESARLESIIIVNERHIARKLAAGAARDLKALLDRGSVRGIRDLGRLENTVEKGLAVLLDEARELRMDADEGRIKKEEWEVKREEIEREFAVLNEVAVRLRGMVEEEWQDEVGDEDDSPGSTKDDGTEKFDGFGRNL